MLLGTCSCKNKLHPLIFGFVVLVGMREWGKRKQIHICSKALWEQNSLEETETDHPFLGALVETLAFKINVMSYLNTMLTITSAIGWTSDVSMTQSCPSHECASYLLYCSLVESDQLLTMSHNQQISVCSHTENSKLIRQ